MNVSANKWFTRFASNFVSCVVWLFGWRIYVFVIFVIVVVVLNDFQLCITHTHCVHLVVSILFDKHRIFHSHSILQYTYYCYTIHIFILVILSRCMLLKLEFLFWFFYVHREFNMLWGWENIYIFKWTHYMLTYFTQSTIQWHQIKYEKSKYAKKKLLL